MSYLLISLSYWPAFIISNKFLNGYLGVTAETQRNSTYRSLCWIS